MIPIFVYTYSMNERIRKLYVEMDGSPERFSKKYNYVRDFLVIFLAEYVFGGKCFSTGAVLCIFR